MITILAGLQEDGDDVPGLLRGLRDGLGEALAAGNLVRPTFTYEPFDTSHARRR